MRLLSRAKDEGDWELCKELARFLTALDESGATLREALEMVNLRSPQDERSHNSFLFEGTRLKVPRQVKSISPGTNGDGAGGSDHSSTKSRSPGSGGDWSQADYFSHG